MNKLDFEEYLFKNFIIVGSNNFEFAVNEIERLKLSKNLLINKYSEKMTKEKNYRNMLIKGVKRNGILSFREGNNFYMSNIKGIITDEVRRGYKEIVFGFPYILKNENLNLDLINKSDNGLLEGSPWVNINCNNINLNLIFVPVSCYRSVIDAVNSNKDKSINYLILEEENIKKYKAFSFELGIKYRYLINKNNKSFIFKNWNEIDEWTKDN